MTTSTPTTARQALADAQSDQATAEQDRDALQVRADAGEDVASQLVISRERAVIMGNRCRSLQPAADAEHFREVHAAWSDQSAALDATEADHRRKAGVLLSVIEGRLPELADHAAALDEVNRARRALGGEPGTDQVIGRTPHGLQLPDWTLSGRVRALLDQRERDAAAGIRDQS